MEAHGHFPKFNGTSQQPTEKTEKVQDIFYEIYPFQTYDESVCWIRRQKIQKKLIMLSTLQESCSSNSQLVVNNIAQMLMGGVQSIEELV